ncbi:MAG: hypothetical protein ACRD6N_17780 [Pyrinomonadaceae bacterium]
MRVKCQISLLLLLFAPTALAANNHEVLARKALSVEVSESAPAIAELRAMGPAGLDALLQTYRVEIKRQIENPAIASTAEWQRLTATLDAVSQQKDSYLSQLYWYTDFKEAKEAAHASGKPILSLRLLGKLSEEFSCANSRFFRAVLYPNAQVSNALREGFVLHWQTVRAVPRITIDFGDGRKLERTVTGNSIHYILDPDGRLIDALPGLYGPAAFLRSLTESGKILQQLEANDDAQRNLIVSAYHRARANALTIDWLSDTAKIGGKPPEGLTIAKGSDGQALAIMPIAMTKAMTESTMLRSMTAGAEALGRITDEAAWNKIALLHALDGQLDAASIGLIQRQTLNLFANDRAGFNNLVQRLQLSIALDTVRNEYLIHTKLHVWMSRDRSRENIEALNERVYAELFLTPRSDPWLGLLSRENYTGLENAGVVR